MPMPAKGARLVLRKRAGRPDVWVIKDLDYERSTGTGDRREAEVQLADHIARKNRTRGPAAPQDLNVGDVLEIYLEQHAPTVAAPERLIYAVKALGSGPVTAMVFQRLS